MTDLTKTIEAINAADVAKMILDAPHWENDHRWMGHGHNLQFAEVFALALEYERLRDVVERMGEIER